MSVQNGDVVILQIGGVQVGALVSNSTGMSADMLDKTNKDDPGVKQFMGGETGWTMSLESLYDPAASEGISEAIGYLKAGTEITVLFGISGGSTIVNGSALISSVDLSGPKNEISSYSIEIQGTGELEAGYGPELHTSANAASDPNGNEADATTGWNPTSLTGTGANVFESQSSIKNTGSYALHADANDTPTNGARFSQTFTVEAGESYLLEFYWRHVGTGGAWALEIASVYEDHITSSDTTFVKKSVTIVAASTSLNIGFEEYGSANSGGLYVDNLSLKKIL